MALTAQKVRFEGAAEGGNEQTDGREKGRRRKNKKEDAGAVWDGITSAASKACLAVWWPVPAVPTLYAAGAVRPVS
jgi:hypothetical protein